ncbi:hypothetical protein INQ51_17045 [Maribellus sp. CM-23]|uniref:hypothetical protein n=1 Tax=Maribellus sp. CM-23 TaxID=2781026 RepID=UPI001F30B63F|nr:hypothetical protein [Maribellus sp. CM-23]MCE4566029.1 hypothetical protein [Maribellus sp. CM-23]
MKMEYIKFGRCIWCLKQKPDVTFFNKPHTISKKLGSNVIGFDICDSCNTYFGSVEKSSPYQMSVETAFKEILNVSKYIIQTISKKPDKNKPILRSMYFEYYRSKGLLRIKNRFKLQRYFIKNFTRQFKRGIYEIFLQEFHRQIGEGHLDKFDRVRNFTRFDIGDIPLYYADNNGVYLLPDDIDQPLVPFTPQSKSEINDYGFYQMWLYGHLFYIEVTPKAEFSRQIYLRNEERKIVGSGFIYNGINELNFITDLDFTLSKLTGS